MQVSAFPCRISDPARSLNVEIELVIARNVTKLNKLYLENVYIFITNFYQFGLCRSSWGYIGRIGSCPSAPDSGVLRIERMSELYCLVEQEIPRLRRYARALTRASDRADNLVQDTLLRALTKLHLWQPGTDIRAWLFTIMHHQ